MRNYRKAGKATMAAAAVLALVVVPSAAFASDEAPTDTVSVTSTADAAGTADSASTGAASQDAPEPADSPHSTSATPSDSEESAPVKPAPKTAPAAPEKPAVTPKKAATPKEKKAAPQRDAVPAAPKEQTPSAPSPEKTAPVAAASASADSDPTESDKKVLVCKYVGTPGVNERLNDNLLEVSINTLKGWDGKTFPWEFPDAQGRSVAIGFVGSNLTIKDCPPVTPKDTVLEVPTLRWAQADCANRLGSYSLSTPQNFRYEAPGGASIHPTGPLPKSPIEVYAVADEGFTFAAGKMVHVATIPQWEAPLGCEEPPIGITPAEPTSASGTCLATGEVSPATVTVPDEQDGVSGYTILGDPVAFGQTIDVPYGIDILWTVDLEDGYELAVGASGSGTLGPIDKPECTTVKELTEVTPEIEPGLCQDDGTASPPTVTTPALDGVDYYVIYGERVAPGATLEVPYATEISWTVMPKSGYVLADGVIGEGQLGPIAQPECAVIEDPPTPVEPPTQNPPAPENPLAPVNPLVPKEPIVPDSPLKPAPSAPVATAKTVTLAPTGSDVVVALIGAASLIAAGGLALAIRRRREA